MPGIEIKGRSKIANYRHGGRISKQLGGVGNIQPITGTRRFDQSRGYYQPDMGMRGGAMYNKGGRAGFKHGTPHHEDVKKWISRTGKKRKMGKRPRAGGPTHINPKWVENRAEGGRIGLKKGGNGKWMQKVSASIKKRGTKGKCTPITKPGCTGRAKALAKTFKKIAAKRKA